MRWRSDNLWLTARGRERPCENVAASSARSWVQRGIAGLGCYPAQVTIPESTLQESRCTSLLWSLDTPAQVPVWNGTESCPHLPPCPGELRQQNPPRHGPEQKGGCLSCPKSSSSRFWSCLGSRELPRAADAGVWGVPGGPAAPNPLAQQHGRALGVRVVLDGCHCKDGRHCNDGCHCKDGSPASAHEGLHTAGCMLKIGSSKSSRLLGEQRRQSFGVHLCYYFSKKSEFLVCRLSVRRWAAEQGAAADQALPGL